MHPVRRQRLITVLFIVLGSSTVIGLGVFGMRESLNLFYPPSKIVAGAAPIGRTIKAGGCVVPGSIKRLDEGLHVRFDISDGLATIPVVYDGILPDLFGEGEAAVVDGKLDKDGLLTASRVLAKHDENYTPAEVSKNLNTTKEKVEGEDHLATCESVKYDS